jgi:hypothetical protein
MKLGMAIGAACVKAAPAQTNRPGVLQHRARGDRPLRLPEVLAVIRSAGDRLAERGGSAWRASVAAGFGPTRARGIR